MNAESVDITAIQGKSLYFSFLLAQGNRLQKWRAKHTFQLPVITLQTGLPKQKASSRRIHGVLSKRKSYNDEPMGIIAQKTV